MFFRHIHVIALALPLLLCCREAGQGFLSPGSTVLTGMAGGVARDCIEGRIKSFIDSPQSPAVIMFSPENRTGNPDSWKGEHAGKWLCAASTMYRMTGDPDLGKSIASVACGLVSWQDEDGYLGCCLPGARFCDESLFPATNVGWDLWNCAYTMKGLAEASVALDREDLLDAACRIAGLMYRTFVEEGRCIAETGHHAGLASLGLIEPVSELYELRPDSRLKALAERCMDEMGSAPGLGLIQILEGGQDLALAGDGKIYETIRCLTGLARWARLAGDGRLLRSCLNGWENIVRGHLTPCGGPWGGVNVHAEVFNRDCCFSPAQVAETCSSMEWMNFNAELMRSLPEARFAEEIEKTYYNAILPARKADGHRWVYYIRTNGDVTTGHEWSCCWSSGTMALGNIAGMVFSHSARALRVNVYAGATVCDGGFKMAMEGDYAHTGEVRFRILESSGRKELQFRKPCWADSWTAELGGSPVGMADGDGYLGISRRWKPGDEIVLRFPVETREIRRSVRYIADGKFDIRLVKRVEEYAAYARGPLVLCNGPEGKLPLCDYLPFTDEPGVEIWTRVQ